MKTDKSLSSRNLHSKEVQEGESDCKQRYFLIVIDAAIEIYQSMVRMPRTVEIRVRVLF